jgi:hypothetical protein
MDWKDVLILLGFLGTGGALGSWVHEWRRGRREDRFRWHNERRAVYERFLTAIDKWRSTELEIAEYLGGLRHVPCPASSFREGEAGGSLLRDQFQRRADQGLF